MATYTIDSVQDLIDLTLRSGKFLGIPWKDNVFSLTTDLDLVGVDPLGDGLGWWPIGQWASGDFFNGVFHGNGYIISNVTMDRSASEHGGFFGCIDPDADGASWEHDTVTDLGLENVNISGKSYVGGLVGYVLGANYSSGWGIKNCYVTGIVTTTRLGGGFVGGSNNGYYKDCYTDVQVNCVNSRCELGSFIGAAYIGARCENCYGKGLINNSGPVTGDTEVGGFSGSAVVTFSGTDCFWDKDTTSKVVDGVNGIAVGKTTAEMKQQATFINWDFDNDWWIDEGNNYPILREFVEYPTQASDPIPANFAVSIAIASSLSWMKDSGDSVDVYFDKKSEHDPPITKVIDNQDVLLYDSPSDLDNDVSYVWRVDTKDIGTTAGIQWEFTTITGGVSLPRLVKGGNSVNSQQIKSKTINGSDFTDHVCPRGAGCREDCRLIGVPNSFHPGTKDSIINFSND